MEELYPTLVQILKSSPVSESSQLLCQDKVESEDKGVPVENVNPDFNIVKKSKEHHVQYCAGGSCGNNRFDNPGQ
jgi:hypothetical protein